MFEFPNKDSEGHLDIFDDAGHYKLYDSPFDAFADCEPRLSATVILPMSQFKNQTIELRRGIWTGVSAATMGPLMTEAENFASDYASKYGADSDLKIVNGFAQNSPIDIGGGKTMAPAGNSGIVSWWDFGNISGFYLRKYLNPDPDHNNNGNKSTQSWIEIRYAEVLLNMAEAAWELTSLGDNTDKDGNNYLEVAYDCMNKIRKRGGATLLAAVSELNGEEGRDLIRTERRKELAFEHKAYWDLKRWRIMYDEQNNTRWRTIAPFYSVVDGKYFIDIKYQESRGQNYVFTYDTRNYYQQIPTSETTRNTNCKQNPGY